MEKIVRSIQLAGANSDFKVIVHRVLLHIPNALASHARPLPPPPPLVLWLSIPVHIVNNHNFHFRISSPGDTLQSPGLRN